MSLGEWRGAKNRGAHGGKLKERGKTNKKEKVNE
jgi:hypothetical protein